MGMIIEYIFVGLVVICFGLILLVGVLSLCVDIWLEIMERIGYIKYLREKSKEYTERRMTNECNRLIKTKRNQ